MLAGCASNAPLDTLKPQGPISRSIDSLSDPIFLLAGIVFILIFGASGLIWWKFRDDHSSDEFPPQIHGHFRAEIGWTIGPAILMVAIGVFTLFGHFELNSEDRTDIVLNVDGVSTSWDPEIVVVGQQWWWEFRYYFDGLDGVDLSDPRNLPPADIVTATQMVIPTGSEIGLSITSRDVIHSFWIPALNGKRDAVPRRISPWKIEADVPGFYFGQCTEFCGLSHSRMQMQAVAMTPVDFQAWVDEQMQPAAQPTDAAAERGLAVFEGQCTRCH
ncbi:MAG TPA: cytochrome c oxidase subunit II, partial [Acidimicrobiaceae bacterium]|nr:cytochrome c oxidase subunit II [Acidimicrobiaceae bacterium]